MLNRVGISPKSLDAYREAAGEEAVEEIRALAEPLKGARVLHVNATAYGGGVAEILHTLVGLMTDVGLAADWQVIDGSEEFFSVTKLIHNGLQGMDVPWTKKMEQTWAAINQQNADGIDPGYDFYVIHDPQPAGLATMVAEATRSSAKWIWRCHIDTANAHRPIWDYLSPSVDGYDATIFTLPEYDRGSKAKVRVHFPPCIDPLSAKNCSLDRATARQIVSGYGIDVNRPLITQVSRFDPWKDPVGVIKAYRMVKEEIPGLQLAMVGSMADDDPEGQHYYNATIDEKDGDTDIVVLSNFDGVGNTEVNAFQMLSDVVLQKSIVEGFGLTASEALWKGTPVVAGAVGGLRLQVRDDENGYLVDSIESCAEATLRILKDREKAQAMGDAGREWVRGNFLSTRNLRDYLTLFNRLNGGAMGSNQA